MCTAPQVLVFFSSCNSVKYHAELFNFIDVPVLDLHRSWLEMAAVLGGGSSPLGLSRPPRGLRARPHTTGTTHLGGSLGAQPGSSRREPQVHQDAPPSRCRPPLLGAPPSQAEDPPSPTHRHGDLKQNKRTTTFFDFCAAKAGILLCTDVAARGLDIPHVDWIVQYDPPDEPKEYIHRVGRTARAGGKGRALLVLQPEELTFLKYLKQAKVPLSEFDFPAAKLANVQPQLEKLVAKNYYLHKSARDAYRSYLHAYNSHSLKDVYDVHGLNLLSVAKSFGFTAPPKVTLNLKPNAKEGERRKSQGSKSTGFSKDNPYGKQQQAAGDRRQFSR